MDKNRLSDVINAVQPSATIGMSQKARSMMADGKDVIILSQGEPDFETPEHIKLAAVEALASGKTRYTAVDGIPELKKAIQRKFKRDNGLHYETDNISVAPGGKAILFNAFVATLNPNDEVIIPAPCWVSYPEMVRLCGGRPVVIATGAETQFKLTADLLESAITAQTKWVVLNSPSNPTGSVLSSDDLEALAKVLRRHPNVMVLTDDIYEHLVYGEAKFSTIAQLAPDLKDRILTMNGMSKAYAMTGWRLGYAGGPKWLIAAMRKVMGQSTSNPNSIAQYAAIEALEGDQSFLKQWRSAFEKRRDLVCSKLNEIGLQCTVPDGAFYVFANCETFIGKTSSAGRSLNSDLDWAEALLEEELVAVVPGSAFHVSGHFRLSYADSDEILGKALARIKAFCQGCH